MGMYVALIHAFSFCLVSLPAECCFVTSIILYSILVALNHYLSMSTSLKISGACYLKILKYFFSKKYFEIFIPK